MHTTLGFTGQREDSTSAAGVGASGLDYFNGRYYDPAIGRFASADSVRGADPLADAYAYVGGHVEVATDPTGHEECADCGGEGGEPEGVGDGFGFGAGAPNGPTAPPTAQPSEVPADLVIDLPDGGRIVISGEGATETETVTDAQGDITYGGEYELNLEPTSQLQEEQHAVERQGRERREINYSFGRLQAQE